mmetsp:Transcript_27992/g.56192  ORF Transcript_27992/g.56192 Transcript_27992/m.56192 type:complete len:272 (+) Transcript_27992:388-1203(+)
MTTYFLVITVFEKDLVLLWDTTPNRFIYMPNFPILDLALVRVETVIRIFYPCSPPAIRRFLEIETSRCLVHNTVERVAKYRGWKRRLDMDLSFGSCPFLCRVYPIFQVAFNQVQRSKYCLRVDVRECIRHKLKSEGAWVPIPHNRSKTFFPLRTTFFLSIPCNIMISITNMTPPKVINAILLGRVVVEPTVIKARSHVKCIITKFTHVFRQLVLIALMLIHLTRIVHVNGWLMWQHLSPSSQTFPHYQCLCTRGAAGLVISPGIVGNIYIW